MSSSITILGGNQALEYEFETRLAQLKAQDLVDELFDELEQSPSSPEVLAAELLALDTTTADLFEPLKGWERPDLPDLDDDDCLAVPFVPCSDARQPFTEAFTSTQDLGAAAVEAATAQKLSSKLRPTTTLNYRLLLGIASVSLVGLGAVTLSLLNQLYWSKPTAVVAAVPAPATTVDPATVQFAQYLERAFENANQQAAIQPAPNPAVTNAAGAVPVAGVPASSSGQPVERVYVPIYQPPAPQSQAPQTVASLPTTPATAVPVPKSPTAAVPLPPPPQARVPGRLPSSVQGYLPNPVRPNPTHPNSNSSRPNPGRRPAGPTSRTAPMSAVVAPAAPESTLIGVMELGDRSVAMIELNGATQRVSIGQTLDSGWQLMQVADQKVIMQRGGEIRSLAVGQKF